MNKLKELYARMSEAAAGLSWNEKALTLAVIFIFTPAIYLYAVYPWQAGLVKKAAREHSQAKARYERIAAEQDRCDRMKAEVAAGEEVSKFINGLVMNPDDAVQMINVISEMIARNDLSINFIKNSAQFERIYEKTHAPRNEAGEIDAAARFSYKVLPVEFAFRSTPLDFMAFLNIVEGFRNLNFNIRRMSASRSNDGKVDVSIIVEIIIELNLFSGRKNS